MTADIAAYQARAEDYDAVVIPGGYAPDLMRGNPAMVELVRQAYHQGKVVAAICHAGWMLASAGIARGKRLTGLRSIRDDLVNAGASWVDEPVVRDRNLITSRIPEDLLTSAGRLSLPYWNDSVRRQLLGMSATLRHIAYAT